MIFPGHVAAAALAARALGTDMPAALAASMCPDLVDKPVRWVLRVTPNDRIPAHSLFFMTGTTMLAYLFSGPRAARGWATGYGAHLLCDEINSHLNPGRIYFWWPFKRYHLHTGPRGLRSSLSDFTIASLVLEAAISIAAVAAFLPGRMARATATSQG